MELIEAYRIVRKRIWMIGGIILAACLLAGIYSSFLVSPTYKASSKLVINYKPDEGNNVLDLNKINSNILLKNSYKEIIESEAILDKVAKQHPEFSLTGKELTGMVSSDSSAESQVMNVSVTNHDYRLAAQIVNAVAITFQQEIPGIMNVDNVTILSAADPGGQPVQVSPKPLLNLVLAFVLSAMFSIGLAFLLEYLDDTFKSEADVEKVLGLPTLTQIVPIRKEDLLGKESKPLKPLSKNPKAGERRYAPAKP